jgi:hypothetical protein
MRPARRKTSRQGRRQTEPGRARVTAPRAVAALRRGREALCDIQSQLDAILGLLQQPDANAGAVDRAAPDRLAAAAREANRALASLGEMRRLLPTRS